MSVLLQELLLALRVYLSSSLQSDWIHLSNENKLAVFACVVIVCVVLFEAYSTRVYEEVELLSNRAKKGGASGSENHEVRRNELGSPVAPSLYYGGNNLSSMDEGEEVQYQGLRSRSQSLDDDESIGMVDGSMSYARDRDSPSNRRRTHSSDSETGGGILGGDIMRGPPLVRQQQQQRYDDSSVHEMSMVSSIGDDDDSNDAGDMNEDPRGIQVIPLDKLHTFIERFSRNGVIVSVYRKRAFRKRCLKLDPVKRCLYWKDERRVLELRRRRREWPIDDVVSLIELGVVRTEEITNANRGLLRSIFGGGQELLVARGPGAVTTSFGPGPAPVGGDVPGPEVEGRYGANANVHAPAVELRVGSGAGNDRRGSVEGGLAALLVASGQGPKQQQQQSQDGSPRATLDSDTKHAVALKLRSSSAPGRGKVYQLFFESRAEAHWLFRHFASLLYHLRGRAVTSEVFRMSDQASLQSISLDGNGSDNGRSGFSSRPRERQGQLEDDDSVNTYNTLLHNEGYHAPSMDQPLGLAHQRGRNPATQTFQSLHPR